MFVLFRIHALLHCTIFLLQSFPSCMSTANSTMQLLLVEVQLEIICCTHQLVEAVEVCSEIDFHFFSHLFAVTSMESSITNRQYSTM